MYANMSISPRWHLLLQIEFPDKVQSVCPTTWEFLGQSVHVSELWSTLPKIIVLCVWVYIYIYIMLNFIAKRSRRLWLWAFYINVSIPIVLIKEAIGSHSLMIPSPLNEEPYSTSLINNFCTLSNVITIMSYIVQRRPTELFK